MEIAVEWVFDVRAGTVEGTHLPDHRQDGGEGAFGGVGGEGDVQDVGGVDEGVDCGEVVSCWTLESGERLGNGFGGLGDSPRSFILWAVLLGVLG